MREKDLDIISKNLGELYRREEITEQQRSLCIAQLISAFTQDDDLSLDALYRELNIYTNGVLSSSDKAELCRNIVKARNICTIYDLPTFIDTDISVTPGSHGKIAYVRNRYNDLAYAELSEIIPHSKPTYFSNFEECADAVTNGICEFAIIPIEDTSDGKMFGFYSLIDRYELRLSAVCNIENEDSSKIVRYALVSRNFVSEKTEKLNGKRPKIFEFSLTYGSDSDPFDILCAAEKFYAKIVGISSVFLPYNDTQTRFYYSFNISDTTDLYALLLYLWAEYPQYTPIGIYYEI